MLTSLLLALTLPSQAGAYYFVDAGTRGMSRGGAYIAGNRDLTAQYYNPAALINLDSGQVMLNFSLVDQRAGFKRMDLDSNGEVVKEYKEVDNIAAPMKIPSFGIAHHFGVPNTMFALGLHPPYAPDKEYKADGPQRYTLIDAKVQQFFVALSAAHQPFEWLTIGAGLLWNVTRADQELALKVCNRDWDDNEAFADASCAHGTREVTDLVIRMEMVDKARINANFGVLIDPTDNLTVGLSVTPPMKVKGKGSLSARFSENHWLVAGEPFPVEILATPEARDDDISVELTMPMVVRGGVAFRPIKNLEIEFATVYERWSQHNEVLISKVRVPLMLGEAVKDLSPGLEPEVPINGPVSLPADYNDTFSYRLGGEWDAKEWLSIRSGVYYEKSAIPTRLQGVGLMDGNKIGYGIGASYHHKDVLSFDLALSQSFLGTRKMRNSELKNLEVPISINDAISEGGISTNIENGSPIANGDLSSTLTMLSAGITYYFGKPTPRTY